MSIWVWSDDQNWKLELPLSNDWRRKNAWSLQYQMKEVEDNFRRNFYTHHYAPLVFVTIFLFSEAGFFLSYPEVLERPYLWIIYGVMSILLLIVAISSLFVFTRQRTAEFRCFANEIYVYLAALIPAVSCALGYFPLEVQCWKDFNRPKSQEQLLCHRPGQPYLMGIAVVWLINCPRFIHTVTIAIITGACLAMSFFVSEIYNEFSLTEIVVTELHTTVMLFCLFFFYFGKERDAREVFETRLILAKAAEEAKVRREESIVMANAILPPSVVHDVVCGNLIAHDMVATVLLVDVVNFTVWCQHHNLPTLVCMLSDLMSQLDSTAQSLDITKIKTLGDGYLATCGIPSPTSNHVPPTIHFASECHEIISNLDLSYGTLQFRIGIHTGQVTGTVVGHRRHSYEIGGKVVKAVEDLQRSAPPGRTAISLAVLHEMPTLQIESGPFTLRSDGENIVSYVLEPVVVSALVRFNRANLPDFNPEVKSLIHQDASFSETFSSDLTESCEGETAKVWFQWGDQFSDLEVEGRFRAYLEENYLFHRMAGRLSFCACVGGLLIGALATDTTEASASLVIYCFTFSFLLSVIWNLLGFLQRTWPFQLDVVLFTVCVALVQLQPLLVTIGYEKCRIFSTLRFETIVLFTLLTLGTILLHSALWKAMAATLLLIVLSCMAWFWVLNASNISFLACCQCFILVWTATYHEIAAKRFTSQEQLMLQHRVIAKELHSLNRILELSMPSDVVPQVMSRLKGNTLASDPVVYEIPALVVSFCRFDLSKRNGTLADNAGAIRSLISRVDQLLCSSPIERVKMIGDCVMIAGPLDQTMTVSNTPPADLSRNMLEMIAGMNRMLEEVTNGSGKMRCGVHIGPATAAVIGHTVLVYDVFGTTVNYSARLLQHCTQQYLDLACSRNFVDEVEGKQTVSSINLLSRRVSEGKPIERCFVKGFDEAVFLVFSFCDITSMLSGHVSTDCVQVITF